MQIDPQTPVLVGVGSRVQREAEPGAGKEAVQLMVDAVRTAAHDSGAPQLLTRADAVLVPRGMWGYPDPGRLVAEALGCREARSLLAEVGILQTSLFGRAGRAIASGEAEVVVVCGGEAKYRSRVAERAGVALAEAQQPASSPDEVLRPAADILHPLELLRGLGRPVNQYAILESALRAAEGQGVDAHRDAVAHLWSDMSEVAARNPYAWRRQAVSAQQIRGGDGNHMMAFPYTVLHNSEWNVDQAAALLFCSYAVAESAGIPRDRLVFLRAVTESNHMLPLAERAEPHRAPAAGIAGMRALELAGLALEQIAHRELYSCFPVAVRIQARELGISLETPPTVTGGMAFGGGPLNNFVLQATARMAEVLRSDPESAGLVTAISGIFTKLGASIWSTQPGPFGFDDVSEAVAAATRRTDVREGESGEAVIAGYTVIHGRGGPEQAVALCDFPGGRRTIAYARNPALMDAMMRKEHCGTRVSVSADGVFAP